MRSKEKSAFASDDSLTADEMLSETLSETSDSSPSSKDVVVEDEIDKENKRKKRKIILFSSLGAAWYRRRNSLPGFVAAPFWSVQAQCQFISNNRGNFCWSGSSPDRRP